MEEEGCRMGAWVFFFSSRRRHTRYWRDWSSDVCSSDLRKSVRRRAHHRGACARVVVGKTASLGDAPGFGRWHYVGVGKGCPLGQAGRGGTLYVYRRRSEERRVGKECSYRWSPYH